MAHILIIDDENNIRMMVRLALQHAGHTVETASDGPEGLEKFGQGASMDLVLLDQRMPGMEGLDVLREIRRRAPMARIIMITAFGTIDLAVEAMKAGAADFLRKPFTAETLRGAVQTALDETVIRDARMPPHGKTPVSISYAMTTINGFRIETQNGTLCQPNGEIRYDFAVRNPIGEICACVVQLPVYLVELIKAHADLETMPGGERFWQSFCEEALANYVWQQSEFPPEGTLRVEELTTSLRRWVDRAITLEHN